MKSEELVTLAVYEYARSCPWVSTLWQGWLNSFIPTCRTVNLDQPTVIYDQQRKVRLGDVFRKEYPAGIPAWPRDATADLMVYSLPAYLREIAIEALVFCVPSFPKPWSELPKRERDAALQLLRRPSSLLFRDAKEPPEPGDHVFKVAIDIDQAAPGDIRRSFQTWLAEKLRDYERKNPGSKETRHPVNPGRSASPPYETLRWLGAYRFQMAGFRYKDAWAEVERRQKALPDPPSGRFPKLPTYDDASSWFRAVGRAKRRMVETFTPLRGEFVPSALLRFR